MKLVQIAFLAVLGSASLATFVTSETLHQRRVDIEISKEAERQTHSASVD